MNGPIRVVVVDDSAFVRKVIVESLHAADGIVVVGTARDGLDALERIAELRPDVVTLDLVMPNLDGIGVLEHLRGVQDAPRVVVVTTNESDSELAIAALEHGAIDLVHKPTSLASDSLYALADDLVEKVRNAAYARIPARASGAVATAANPRPRSGTASMLVVGASTGGPNAFAKLLPALSIAIPVPVVVVLHIPEGYTAALAARWDKLCALDVVEATEQLVFRPGQIVVARAGVHLAVCRDGDTRYARLEPYVVDGFHRPSLDRVFESASVAYEGRVLGVILTGMGDDGLRGARAIHAAGGVLITEAERSCVVYGMPRCIDEAGLSSESVPIEEMADAIMRRL